MSEIIVAKDIPELNRLAAEKFVSIAADAVDRNDRVTVALSGGSTPKSLFLLLASEPFRSEIDWENILFFFGDERNVALDSDESNFRMANENLFLPLNIRSENVFRWKTELNDPAATAKDYETAIRAAFPGKFPTFDIVFLGMGADGHTASLFPGSSGLDERDKIAIANPVPKLDTTRLTLTFPVFNAAANVIFLVAGADKASVLARVLEGDGDYHELPSRGIQPISERLYWYVDAVAAQYLPR